MELKPENHKKKLHKITAKVDDKPPRLVAGAYLKITRFTDFEKRLLRIMQQNQQLLSKLNEVNRTMGYVDCWQTTEPKTSRTYHNRMVEAMRIDKENVNILKMLQEAKPKYSTKDLLTEWRKTENTIEQTSKFPLHWKASSQKEELDELGGAAGVSNTRVRVFLDIGIENGRTIGRMIFELFPDIVPKTTANFIGLCSGYNDLTYKNSRIYRIIPDLFCIGGDIINNNGLGGKSIYGSNFENENFLLSHGSAGVISMYSRGPDSNNSQFIITFKALKVLDGKYVVFGILKQGIRTLQQIQELGAKSGKPLAKVMITDCGVIN